GPSTAARDNNAEDLLLTGFSVMRRRANGEQITVAQNLFEPELSGPVTRPSVEQGDDDQDGLKIVLASAPPPTAKKSSASGKWIVQVGAFKKRSDANEQLDLVRKRFATQFAGARGVADSAGGRYRARFSGFTEAKAKDACKALKAKKLACA